MVGTFQILELRRDAVTIINHTILSTFYTEAPIQGQYIPTCRRRGADFSVGFLWLSSQLDH